MKGFLQYAIRTIFILLKILIVLLILGLIAYFALNKYIDSSLQTEKAEKHILPEPDNVDEGDDGLRTESEKNYAKCMNKAYQDYKDKYDRECEKNIMDGQCQISQEMIYGLQGVYDFDKKQCEKLVKP